MTFYALRTVPGNPCLHTLAKSRAEALSDFAKVLGYAIIDKPSGQMAEHALNEWDENPHWVNPTILIWKKR